MILDKYQRKVLDKIAMHGFTGNWYRVIDKVFVRVYLKDISNDDYLTVRVTKIGIDFSGTCSKSLSFTCPDNFEDQFRIALEDICEIFYGAREIKLIDEYIYRG